MRPSPLILASIIALAPAATPVAAATVQVAVARQLRDKAEHDYGVRDVQQLVDELRGDVERSLAKHPELADARVRLVLTDVKPSRPTQAQMSHQPGLSYSSISNGGASIEGQVRLPNGTVTPVSYKWYETDIREAFHKGAWSDASRTFDRFAAELPGRVRRSP